MNQIGKEDLRQILQEANTPSSYQGVVGSGSTTTAVVDSVGGWATNQWAQYGIQFAQSTVTAALRGVWQQITSNTANTLTLAAALPAAPVAGDTYDIRVFGSQVQDVTSWGGQPVSAASSGYPLFALTTPGSGGVPAGINEATGAALPNYLNGLDTNAFCYQWNAATSEWVPVALNVGAPGSAAPANAVQVAGTDGTDLRVLSTDTSGHINANIVSPLPAGTNTIGSVVDSTLAGATGSPGTAAPANAIQVAGSDGTDLRALSTTTSGELLVAPGTNPFPVAKYAALVANETNVSTSATTPVLSTDYSVPGNGGLNIEVAIASGASATTFLVSQDANAASPTYLALNQGTNLTAGALYAFSVPAASGDEVNFETEAATTLALLKVWFVTGQ